MNDLVSGTLVFYEQQGTSNGFSCCMLVSGERLLSRILVSYESIINLSGMLVSYESIVLLSGV